MLRAKPFLLLLILAGTAFFMPHAKATCTTPDVPFTAQMDEIRVSSTLAPGSTIPGTEQHVTVHGTCPAGLDGMPVIGCFYGSGAETPGYPGVYETGVTGIGITLINDQGQRIIGGGVACDTRSTPLGYVSTDGKDTVDFSVTLALVKTAQNVGSGTLQQNQTKFGVGVYRYDGIGNPNNISYAGNISFNEVTCSVSPKSMTVVLGDFPQSAFTGVGSVTPSKQVSLGITCNDVVSPDVMISSANGYETDFPGVIKLTQESGVATGVGVRMHYNGEIATFDVYNELTAETVPNEPLYIPLELDYQQISSQVTPGTANSVATITLGYK